MAVDQIEVEPPTTTGSRFGILAPVCAVHKKTIAASIQRRKDQAEEAKARMRKAKKK